MLGFRVAYDWYLKSRVKSQRQASRFRLKRSALSNKLEKLIQPDLELRNQMVLEFEYNQTQRLLQQSLASAVDRDFFWTHLESRASERNNGYAERREVRIQ